MTKAQTLVERQKVILDLLRVNDRAVERAVVVLYKRQTATEQVRSKTLQANNIGFTATDARILTGYAKLILRGIPLAPYDFIQMRVRITKYSRQLVEISAEKAARKAAKEAQETEQFVQQREIAYGEFA